MLISLRNTEQIIFYLTLWLTVTTSGWSTTNYTTPLDKPSPGTSGTCGGDPLKGEEQVRPDGKQHPLIPPAGTSHPPKTAPGRLTLPFPGTPASRDFIAGAVAAPAHAAGSPLGFTGITGPRRGLRSESHIGGPEPHQALPAALRTIRTPIPCWQEQDQEQRAER